MKLSTNKAKLTGLWAKNCDIKSNGSFKKQAPVVKICNPIQLHIPISLLVGSTAVPPPPPPHGVGTESSFFLDLHVKILGLMSLPLIHHSLQLFLVFYFLFFIFLNYRGGGKSSYLAASKSSSFLYSPIYK